MKASTKSCELYALPACLLKDCLNPLLPIVTATSRQSLSQHHSRKPLLVHSPRKQAWISSPERINQQCQTWVSCHNPGVRSDLALRGPPEHQQSSWSSLFCVTDTALLRVQADILSRLDHGWTMPYSLSASATHLSSKGKLGSGWSYILPGNPGMLPINESTSSDCELYGVPLGSVLVPKKCCMNVWHTGGIEGFHNKEHFNYADDGQARASIAVDRYIWKDNGMCEWNTDFVRLPVGSKWSKWLVTIGKYPANNITFRGRPGDVALKFGLRCKSTSWGRSDGKFFDVLRTFVHNVRKWHWEDL